MYTLQDWTDRFSGLWQSQPRNFLRERAFNQLASRGRTRCCICCLFDVHSPYRGMDSGQIRAASQRLQQPSGPSGSARRGGKRRRRVRVQSLKVVVQRALIELPGSLRRKCSVEGRGGEGQEGTRRSLRVKREPVRDREEEESQLVTCQSCDITVHKGQLPMLLLSPGLTPRCPPSLRLLWRGS